MHLKAGQPAPVFSLPDADMKTVDLASFAGKRWVVLFFYPKDGNPACTQEVTDFSDLEEVFDRENCVLLGVSRDDCLTHAEFRDREGIGISLLSDPEAEVCKLYGVWQPKEVDGHKKYCIVRSTFIIDKAGLIRHALYHVNYKGHAQEVLRLVKELNV